MKRQIRFGVFESNSSSTHSVSISNRRKRVFSDIPKNSTVVLNDTYVNSEELFDELGKLNFVVTMLASIIEYKHDDDEIEINSFEEMIELDWFKWLKELIKEESNTEVVYECPLYWNGKPASCVPYYDTTYDEEDSIESIFTDGYSDVLTNKEKF